MVAQCLPEATAAACLVSDTEMGFRVWEPTVGGVGGREEVRGIKRKGHLRGRWLWGSVLNRRKR